MFEFTLYYKYLNASYTTMSGRKNKFSKAMTHLKSSKIDEKIGYLNKEMKHKRRSYTFDEFIDEMSYAYKTFLHLNRIC